MDNTLYDMLVDAMTNGATDETINTVIAAARKSVNERKQKTEAIEEALRNATVAIDEYCCAIGEDSPSIDDVRQMIYDFHHSECDCCSCEHQDECEEAHTPDPKATAAKKPEVKVSTRKMTEKEVEDTIASFIKAFRSPLSDIF